MDMAMKNVIPFVRNRGALEKLRAEFGLSRAQLAEAIDVAPATIEAWESGRRRLTRDIEELRNLLARRISNVPHSQNLIFGRYRFSLAKELLEMRSDECAEEFGVTHNYWLECEKNRRLVDPLLLKRIEEKVRDQFECAS
jgi:DNA-binding XRE family transcriptional regulator